jgi:sugar transferase (PEP-CTERM/EpsH1 system associated)
MMNVLYFSPRTCWPVDSGARSRDFHLARHLASRAKLTYLGFSATPAPPVSAAPLEPLGHSVCVLVARTRSYDLRSVVLGLLGPVPLPVRNYTRPEMSRELTRILTSGHFDCIQIEGVHLFSYLQQIRALSPHARLICDWHNIESELLERFATHARSPLKRGYARRTAAMLRRCERELLAWCDVHTVCSEREQALLGAAAPDVNIHVVPNGVDVEYFSALAPAPSRREIVFVGSMDYHANIDAALYFANEVWPMLQERRPDLRFCIAGSRPAPEILALSRRPGITVTGTVEDLRPYYAAALAVVVPLRVGGGTRLKVLEAMAAGVPVVATTLGVEGLQVRDAETVLLADTPARTAEILANLDETSLLWQRIAAAARNLVRARYDWSVAGAALTRLYDSLEAARA